MKTINQQIEEQAIYLELEEVLDMLDNNAPIEEIREYVKGKVDDQMSFDKPYDYYTICELLDIDLDVLHAEYLSDMADHYQNDRDYEQAVFTK